MLTLTELQSILPSNMRDVANPGLVNTLNNIVSEPIFAEQIRENFVTFISVLRTGRYKISDYLNAVTYCSFRLAGRAKKEAYELTFPDRYRDLVARGATAEDISSYVAAYNKNKLVTAILEQAVIPNHILYNDAFHSAVKTQVTLMMDTQVSAKVRSDAANSLMTHLKPPEGTKIEIDLGVTESTGMRELKDMMAALVHQQQGLIEAGMQTKTIAHQPLVPKMKDVTPGDKP